MPFDWDDLGPILVVILAIVFGVLVGQCARDDMAKSRLSSQCAIEYFTPKEFMDK